MDARPTSSAYREVWITSQDGLRLYYRDYGDPASKQTPVLCLAGVTRNSKDFAGLARYLSAAGRRVICPDYRGRGRSQYDPDPGNYVAPTYVDDIRHLLTATGVHKAHVIGTSMGGVLAMVMAAAMPGVLASVVLNDIGPEVGSDGAGGIIDYMKDRQAFTDWDTVVAHIQAAFPNLPARSPEDWMAIARSTYRETNDGTLVPDWDHAIVNEFERALAGRATMWPLFKALGRVPVLTVRGALSTILTAETFDRMADVMPAMARVTVADCGHPCGLNEPEVLEAIDALLARA